MRIWRLTPVPFSRSAFSGEGAAAMGGRWNRPGTRMVYASASPSLAVIETLVHLGRRQPFPPMVLHEAFVPDDAVTTMDAVSLPAGWQSAIAPAALAQAGTGWVIAASSVGLVVPSAVVPADSNVLLNPAHPDFGLVRVVSETAFYFDPRLA